MPLTMVKPGLKVIIQTLDSQKCHLPKLQAMGLTKGTELTVVSAEYGGPMILKVRGITIAIGQDIAAAITVATERGLAS